MTTWGDLEDLIPVGNWACHRTTVLHDDGVTEFVHLTILETGTDATWEFFIPVDYAVHMGWHLIGEGARLTYDEELDDDGT